MFGYLFFSLHGIQFSQGIYHSQASKIMPLQLFRFDRYFIALVVFGSIRTATATRAIFLHRLLIPQVSTAAAPATSHRRLRLCFSALVIYTFAAVAQHALPLQRNPAPWYPRLLLSLVTATAAAT